MNKLTRPYQDELIKALENPDEAIAYLNAAIESGSDELFLLALQNVAKAQGITDSANGENIVETIIKVSGSMNIRFAVDDVA